jgi:restriction endonuclease Mrr
MQNAGTHCRSSRNPKVCRPTSGTAHPKGDLNFSKDANDYAAMIDSRIVLVNGSRLCNLMIDHGIGVTRATSYEVKRLDSDYFEES